MDTAEYRLEKQTAQIQSYIKDEKVDSLTGLANRHAFDLRLEELCREYQEGGEAFVLALIDLDQMKWLYDQHGNQAGDLVLRQICNMICSRLEHAITVARFGGGEFSVIVDGSLRDAAETMNQVRLYLQSERINLGSEQVKMTVSVGLSELGTDVVVGPLLRHADEHCTQPRRLAEIGSIITTGMDLCWWGRRRRYTGLSNPSCPLSGLD